jgi:hypothetical protein
VNPFSKQRLELISPLKPTECVSILSAMVEPFQYFGPWPLDTPFMGEVNPDSLKFCRGLKPYTWQPLLRASISAHPQGTLIQGDFGPRISALWQLVAFVGFSLGASLYAQSTSPASLFLLVIGIVFLYEQLKAADERKSIRQLLADALVINRESDQTPH